MMVSRLVNETPLFQQIDLTDFGRAMGSSFSLEDVKQLCFAIDGIDFEDIAGEGKTAKIRELLQQCERKNRLDQLLMQCRKARPGMSWDRFVVKSAEDSPYKGLDSFEVNDADTFFGRDALIKTLITQLFTGQNRFLAVVGASGSGKSSVVKAGLIPAIRQGRLITEGFELPSHYKSWPIYIMKPGAKPLESLAEKLTQNVESVSATSTLIDDLRQDKRSLYLYARKRLAENSPQIDTVYATNDRMILVVDQFEELFTMCKDKVARQAFIDNLVTAVTQQSQNPLIIIITLRSDFYTNCLQHNELHQLLEQSQKIVPKMSPNELREAIEGPAQFAKLNIDSELVNLILRDLGGEPGNLPLLSHTLLETWRRRDGNQLTLKGYTDAGGVQGAIAKTADTVYKKLPPNQQKIAQNIFLRLTELGEGAQDTRRRVDLAELISGKQEDEIKIVVKKLADARLITTSKETAEVAHEALIREWPALRGWLNNNRDGLRLHRQLTLDCQEWLKHNRDNGLLYRGIKLAHLREWALADNKDQLNSLERQFLRLSSIMEKSEKRRVADTQRRELTQAKKLNAVQKNRIKIIRQAIAGLAVLLVIAISMAVFARKEARNANYQRDRSMTQTLAYQSQLVLEEDNDIELAALLALEAYQINKGLDGRETSLVDSSLRASLNQGYWNRVLKGHNGGVWAVAISHDGQMIATGGEDSTIFLWKTNDFSEPYQRLKGHSSWISDLEFSPSGRWLASAGGDDSTVRLWDLENFSQTPIVIHALADNDVYTLSFDPTGAYLAIAGYSPQVYVWQMSQPIEPAFVFTAGEGGYLNKVQFSHDGLTIAGAGSIRKKIDDDVRNYSVFVWQFDKPSEAPIELVGHEEQVTSIAFNPQNRELLSAGYDNILHIWDLDNPLNATNTLQLDDAIVDAKFDSRGDKIITAFADSTIQIWDKTHLDIPLEVLNGHKGSVNSVDISQSDELLISGSSDQTARVWRLNSTAQATSIFTEQDDEFYDLAVDKQEKWLAVAGEGGTIFVWSLLNRDQTPQLLMGHHSFVATLAIHPSQDVLASAGQDGEIILWDLNDGGIIRRWQGHDSNIRSLAFSPNGRFLASASLDQTVRIWDAGQNYAPLFVFEDYEADIRTVAFHPNSNWIATGDMSSVVRLINITNRQQIMLNGHEQGVLRVAFSPDGSTLASGGYDWAVRVWDVTDLATTPVPDKERLKGEPLVGHTNIIRSVAFSSDGALLISTSDDKTSRIWNLEHLAQGQVPIVIAGHEDSVRTAVFLSNNKHAVSVSDDGTVRFSLISLPDIVNLACRAVIRPLSQREIELYIGDQLVDPFRCP